ncbi:MAG: metal-dependent hydrolase [Bacillota bacterium]|nr:metal-dependent hydrolase [Bacillota bacterium]
MKVSYHGHSVVQIQSNGKTILIDPFINGNGLTDLKVEDVHPDVIILTHGHGDHIGDTFEIAKRHNSLIVSTAEIATFFSFKGLRTHGMNIGGAYTFDFGKIKFTQAFHSSGFTTEQNEIIYLGMPMGALFMNEGKTVYHAGDTGLFSDMKLIGERNPIDLAFLPIGDNFTMGPEDAAYAAGLLKAKMVVPIHYNTFPPIKQNPQQFIEMLPTGNGIVMNPGEVIEI